MQVELSTDELDQTVDYEKLTKAVKDHVADNSYKLIETLAYNIASELNKADRSVKTYVVVHKPSAAQDMDIDDVTAEAMVEKS